MARADTHVSLSSRLKQSLLGVYNQVQDHLLNLIGIGHRQGQPLREFALNHDVLDFQFVAAQSERALDNFIDVHTGAFRLVLAREVKQIFHDPASALSFLKYFQGFRAAGWIESASEKK